MKVRPSQVFAIIASFLTLASNCTEEQQFDAPLVQTGRAKVSESGVQLTGYVSQSGSGEVKVGFVWDVDPGPLVDSSPFFGTSDFVTGAFEIDIFYDLLENKTYYYRAYGVSGGTVIYGEQLTFNSLGSNPPEIVGLNPSQAPRGATIEIIGKYFSSLPKHVDVLLGGILLDVLEASPTRLVVKIPDLHYLSGQQTLSVTIAERTHSQLFTVVGPIITSLVPPYAKAGDTLSIIGAGFFPDAAATEVLFGTYGIPVLSVTATKIEALIPYDFTSGNSKIAVRADGVQTYSPNPLEIRDPWSTVQITGDQPFGRVDVVAFMVGGEFYYGLGSIGSAEFRHQIWKYTLSNQQWTRLPNYPAPEATRACFGFGLGTKAFIGVGDNNVGCCPVFKEVWELETTTSTWIQKSDFPGGYRVGPVNFVVNGTAYVGLGAGGVPLKDFYRYNPGSDTWTPLNNFPGAGGGTYTSFTFNGRGYFVQGTELWEYEPSGDSWTLKGPMPANLSNASVVVGVDRVYFFKKEFWEYFPSSGKWIRRADVPGTGLTKSSGYVASGMVFVYGGAKSGSPTFYLNDFLRYNPQP